MAPFVLATWFVLVSVMFLRARADNARVPFSCVVYRKLTIRACAYSGTMLQSGFCYKSRLQHYNTMKNTAGRVGLRFLPSFWGIPKAVILQRFLTRTYLIIKLIRFVNYVKFNLNILLNVDSVENKLYICRGNSSKITI